MRQNHHQNLVLQLLILLLDICVTKTKRMFYRRSIFPPVKQRLDEVRKLEDLEVRMR